MVLNGYNDYIATSFNTREEYLTNLKQWLEKARLWHNLCSGLPYYSQSCFQNLNKDFSNPSNGPSELSYRFLQHNLQQPQFLNAQRSASLPASQTAFPIYDFVIPPLWRRIVAELIDFFILLMMKMVFTFIMIESVHVVSLENYRFETFRKNMQDPKLAMQMSVEILSLEILHRVIVCCYEVYWLKGGPCSTPGKRYMGLMVIGCNNITQSPTVGDMVRVENCSMLGLQKAIYRTVLKNIFLGIMLPMCFTLYIFRFNRTGYDTVSGSLVVKYNPNIQFAQNLN